MKNKIRQYFIPIILVILFAAPGFAAYYFYHHPQWLNSETTNRGELLSPPIALKAGQDAEDKWRLVLWSSQSCDAFCEKQLDKLARIRLTLGRRFYEVDVQLILGSGAKPLSKKSMERLKDQAIHVIQLSQDEYQLSQLPARPKIYIGNPGGYLVLAYSLAANPADIHHDLKRLLKIKE